ncbi:MAG: hypothetical protein FJX53_15960 [Alphaproteobacteria bacterium]|nr:hypothetical protein [Alphaproteobacteria bacterium]
MNRFLTLTAATTLAAALALPALAGEMAKKADEAYAGCSWGKTPAATAATEPSPTEAERAKMIATLDKWLEEYQAREAASVAATPAPVTRPGS